VGHGAGGVCRERGRSGRGRAGVSDYTSRAGARTEMRPRGAPRQLPPLAPSEKPRSAGPRGARWARHARGAALGSASASAAPSPQSRAQQDRPRQRRGDRLDEGGVAARQGRASATLAGPPRWAAVLLQPSCEATAGAATSSGRVLPHVYTQGATLLLIRKWPAAPPPARPRPASRPRATNEGGSVGAWVWATQRAVVW
jgi:hypothetical protein